MPTDKLAEMDAHFRANLAVYSQNLVHIKRKRMVRHGEEEHSTEAVVPFVWNREQWFVHELLERQKELTGKVRAIILKARQRGISTYVGARFYQKTTLHLGQNTFILTHEDNATKTLFGMTKLMHEHMTPEYKPTTTEDSQVSLTFGKIKSKYSLGTARTKATGRSGNIQNFHGSEAAYWSNAEDHAAGVLQAVPDDRNTEIILESTANGPMGWFYKQWTLAVAGKSEYLPIFIPWFWAEDYRKPMRETTELSEEMLEYQELYDLSDEQMQWMYDKCIELNPDAEPGTIVPLFRQEYPANANEAFQATGFDSLISSDVVMLARKRDIPLEEVEDEFTILGMDMAEGGTDDTRIVDRKGRTAGKQVNERHNTNDTMFLADRAALAIDKTGARMLYVDVSAGGAAVVSRLRQMGYEDRVTGVNFGARATENDRFANKRAEMAYRLMMWITDVTGADVPDEDVVHMHLCSVGYRYDAKRRLILWPKEKIKKEFGFSPDWFDAIGLTFAEHILSPVDRKEPEWMTNIRNRNKRRSFMGR